MRKYPTKFGTYQTTDITHAFRLLTGIKIYFNIKNHAVTNRAMYQAYPVLSIDLFFTGFLKFFDYPHYFLCLAV
jgi:hypothetical protein